jgi:transglutaminase-like putative cysteine protease
VHRIYNWVQDNIDFQDDPDKYERLIAPDLALQTIKQYGKLYEDCDSMTALMGSLLKALGIQVKITMAQTDNSNDLSHVYIRAYINQNGQTYIVPMDTTYKDNQIGWEYPTANRIEI